MPRTWSKLRYFKLKTAAASYPVTAANVKLYSRVAHSVEDDLIDTWIAAATKEAEDYQHRAYISQVYTLKYDEYPGSVIYFPRPPLISVDSVKYYDTDDTEAVFSSDNYLVDTTSEVGRLSLNYAVTWPSTILRPVNGVIIEFTAGYGADASSVPDSVKNAIYLFCTHMYENREGENKFPRQFYDLLKPDRMAIY